MKQLFLLLSFCVCSLNSDAISVNVKTIGTTFDPDTVYINQGDTIHFIINIGHDAGEITQQGYINNSMNYFPAGFNYPTGIFDFVPDSVKTYYYACSYHILSDQMKGVIIVSWPAGTEQNLSAFRNIHLYPNPFENYITLSALTEYNPEIFIRNCHGTIINHSTENKTSLIMINTQGWKPGFYFAEIIFSDRKSVLKIIKN